ncbi:phosphate regulon sensor histidine kinase PhoR [Marinomonas sp. 2405UD68-3]|uniref:phosphate regulon sensor histidine kinase PhoR n=1 Tax=Marinomonas sp. 2405UD68-3 TaxID=3391835 RepID=UPI0039C8F0E0
MKKVWQHAFIRWSLGLLVSLTIGFLTGRVFLCLFLFVLIVLCSNLHQLYQFHSWIRRSGKSLPPEASGIWGDVFDAVHRLQKKQRKSKKRMRRALSRIENSTSALKEGVIMADNLGNLEWWNESAGQFLGLMKPVDRGQPITNIVRSPEFFRYFTQKRFSDPLIIKSPKSKGMYLEIQTTLYDKNDHLIFIRDITNLHLLEEMRKDFVANASHELKTPLTVIKGYLETLDMFKDTLPKSMQKGVVNMTEQSDRMEQLIEDLLLLSRLESNDKRETDQWHDVHELIRAIVNSVQVIGKDHTLQIDMQSDSKLYGSYKELYSAFSNLVVNAIKYSPNGGNIIITWKANSKEGVFSVQDEGLGIEARHISRLTERFFRVDKGRGSNTGGTGLGLAIVKHVLLHHDAKLDITSQVGNGSTFSCHFATARIQQPLIHST